VLVLDKVRAKLLSLYLLHSFLAKVCYHLITYVLIITVISNKLVT